MDPPFDGFAETIVSLVSYVFANNTISFERGPHGNRGPGLRVTPVTKRTPFRGNLVIFPILS